MVAGEWLRWEPCRKGQGECGSERVLGAGKEGSMPSCLHSEALGSQQVKKMGGIQNQTIHKCPITLNHS